jgi:uncharacterized protein YecE (DUF72 family)
VRLLAGTSGYAFKEWKGGFYPKELKDDGMLGYYASKFPAVEINNTFYRLPKQNVLLDWAAQVPDTFTFALKASQRITHYARLKEECADTVDFLLKNTESLGDRLGPILFQLPPNMKKDTKAGSTTRSTTRCGSGTSRCASSSRTSSSVRSCRPRPGDTYGCIA